MSPVIFAVVAGIATAIGIAVDVWRPGFIGIAVTAALISMIEALALFRIHMNQVVLHRLSAQPEEFMRLRNGEGQGAPDKPAT